MPEIPSLYVFTLSHFCEKARWACDRKGMRYRLVTLLPGAHLLTVRRFSQKSHVPLLVHGPTVIQDSSSIIDYLDRTFPGPTLTPTEPIARSEAQKWESELDRELGEPLRRLYYHHALRDRSHLRSAYSQGGPFWGPWFYTLALPAIMRAVREMYDVSAANADRDVVRLEEVFRQLDQHFETRRYLAGDNFSRADITLAALAAAIARPAEHPSQKYASRPTLPSWVEQTSRFRESLTAERVREFYRDYRSSRPTA